MRLDVLPHSTGRHPECPGDLLQCEQLQRSGHGTNSMNTAPVPSMRSGPFVRARSAPVIELVFTPSDRVRSKTNTPWEAPRFFKSIDVNPAEWDPFHLPKL